MPISDEQINKVRDYLLSNGQQELVGHFDGLVQERNEALPVPEQPLDEGSAPAPSADISSDDEHTVGEGENADDEETTTAQQFQNDAKVGDVPPVSSDEPGRKENTLR